MINQEICRERFYALLRYGRKYSGSWDDGDCKHGDNYCFLPTDDDIDDLCDAYEQYTALSERHQRLAEAARAVLNAVTVLCCDEYSCFSTCSLANECDEDDGDACLWVARLRAALEGEG